MTELMLDVQGLVKAFGALRATDGVTLDVRSGETHAIIGPNGAGKTTLIAQLSGDLRPDAGRIHFGGEDVDHGGLRAYEHGVVRVERPAVRHREPEGLHDRRHHDARHHAAADHAHDEQGHRANATELTFARRQ